ncbi:MAG: hypothetical protein AAGI17_09010 [Planctomycetota bacterium]
MNVAQLFDHYGITENPFRGEEARDDSVLARLTLGPTASGSSIHSDFDKILGEMVRPTTSIVFGEKGSGKTAIRMQILERVEWHNAAKPDAKLFAIEYDDLNPFIAELDDRFGSKKDPFASVNKFRLVDHMDAILSVAMTRVTASLLGESRDRPAAQLGETPARESRKLPQPMRQDLLLLQALYDNADIDGSRTARLRHLLRLGKPRGWFLRQVGVFAGWIPAAAALAWTVYATRQEDGWINDLGVLLGQVFGGAFTLAWVLVLVHVLGLDRLGRARTARRLHEEMRSLPRDPAALAASIRSLDKGAMLDSALPQSEEAITQRYAMFERFRRILARFGYTGILVIIDRVDEPALIAGDAEKMRAVMWPLFNSKFLQQDRFGVKMLLPIELRHALFRESAAFFQEARLDKQALVERLTWTGPMLYDLCEARLNACREGADEPLSLKDLFAENVSRQDVIDALDQMHQPRDAFKFLYRCLVEHASNVTADQNEWRIPRLVLEQARRAESGRVQELYRGMRPA